MTDQKQFESALVAKSEGQPLMRQIIIHPYNDGQKQIHIVCAQYWDGRKTLHEGQYIARYKDVCFVAPAPYLAGNGQRFSSVGDYLSGVAAPSSYAWWWWLVTPRQSGPREASC